MPFPCFDNYVIFVTVFNNFSICSIPTLKIDWSYNTTLLSLSPCMIASSPTSSGYTPFLYRVIMLRISLTALSVTVNLIRSAFITTVFNVVLPRPSCLYRLSMKSLLVYHRAFLNMFMNRWSFLGQSSRPIHDDNLSALKHCHYRYIEYFIGNCYNWDVFVNHFQLITNSL